MKKFSVVLTACVDMLAVCVCRSQTFQNFVKVLLTKNPKRRPPADKMLEVRRLAVVLIQFSFCDHDHVMIAISFSHGHDKPYIPSYTVMKQQSTSVNYTK